MSNFITKQDFDATVHSEILSALTREDDAIVAICVNRAIEEMTSYLAVRYDTQKIFSARKNERSQLVMMMCLDIAVYHIFCIHNPQKLSQMRKDRYDRATVWLKAVAKGIISIPGLPRLSQSESATKSQYVMRSNPKRQNHR